MIWMVLFLAVAALLVCAGFLVIRLMVGVVAVVGAALMAGAYVIVMGLASLGFLAGLGSLLLLYSTSGNFLLAMIVAVFAGVALPFCVGKKVIEEVKGAIRRIRGEKSEGVETLNKITCGLEGECNACET